MTGSCRCALNQNLFDGGARLAQIAQGRAQLREMTETLRKIKDNVQSEVEMALLKLEEAESRLDVVRGAEAAAAESYKLVEEQYRGGSATTMAL